MERMVVVKSHFAALISKAERREEYIAGKLESFLNGKVFVKSIFLSALEGLSKVCRFSSPYISVLKFKE